MCSDPLKLWFCCIQSTGTAQARIQHKNLKNNAVGCKTLPGAPQNPQKSSPERAGTHQKRPRAATKRNKLRKKRPRCAQERKVSQHSANMAPTWPVWTSIFDGFPSSIQKCHISILEVSISNIFVSLNIEKRENEKKKTKSKNEK